MDIEDRIRQMPKAELHLHLEGTLEPELTFALGARNGVRLPYASSAALRAAYDAFWQTPLAISATPR